MLGKRVVRQLFRVADLLFALGLAALPTLFRQRFGWELQDAFRAHSREVLGRNRSGEALAWSLRSLADLLLVVTLEWLDVLCKDLALSARFCRARSVPDSLQTLTLAVCIATSIGAAGLLNHLVIQPYGYRDVGTLVKFARPISASGASSHIVSLNELRGWQRMEDTFDGIGIYHGSRESLIHEDGGATTVLQYAVTEEMFEVLGVAPEVGRTFAREEAMSVVLGNLFWQKNYGGDPGAVGR